MSGRTLMILAGTLLAAFTVALWYFQFHAFYEDLPQEPLLVQGTEYPLESWQGTDASSSPLKRRICVTFAPETVVRIAADHPAVPGAEPLVAPDWFECFDAKQITRDIAAGKASAYQMGRSEFEGVDEFLAVYPDGRGFVWRALDPRFAQ
ncbi:MAG: DUF6446 family protein [Pseudomonadota bacterium]